MPDAVLPATAEALVCEGLLLTWRLDMVEVGGMGSVCVCVWREGGGSVGG